MQDGNQHTSDGRTTPLSGVRVVDMADGKGEMCGRYLADLGADVVLVEPPEGMRARRAQPQQDGTSLRFLTQSAGKRSVVADLATDGGRERLLGLLAAADIWIEATKPGSLAAAGIT